MSIKSRFVNPGALGALLFFVALALFWFLQHNYLDLRINYYDDTTGIPLAPNDIRLALKNQTQVMRLRAAIKLPLIPPDALIIQVDDCINELFIN